MKTLSLLRHAEAPMGPDDHARPLSPKGVQQAQSIARQLIALDRLPQLILASNARRTLETARIIAGAGGDIAVVADPMLYLALPEAMLDLIEQPYENALHLMVVGHNPGIGQLAYDLSRGNLRAHADGFGTAMLAVFAYRGSDWPELSPAQLTLDRVLEP